MQTITSRHTEHIESYMRIFDWRGQRDGGLAFDCDSQGNLLSTVTATAAENFRKCLAGDFDVIDRGVRDYSRDVRIEAVKRCGRCHAQAYLSRYCGVFVCGRCDEHEGLARCYCGWPHGRGARELVEMGENLESD